MKNQVDLNNRIIANLERILELETNLRELNLNDAMHASFEKLTGNRYEDVLQAHTKDKAEGRGELDECHHNECDTVCTMKKKSLLELAQLIQG